MSETKSAEELLKEVMDTEALWRCEPEAMTRFLNRIKAENYHAGRISAFEEAAKIAVWTINDMRGSGESDLRCVRSNVEEDILALATKEREVK